MRHLNVLRVCLAALALTGAMLPAAHAADATHAGHATLTGDTLSTNNGDLVIHPINHASFAMSWNGNVIYVDPVGGGDRYAGLPRPNLILVTDVHGDHLNADTLAAVATDNTIIVAPAAVAEQLPDALRARTRTLANGASLAVIGLNVEAVPAYNLTQERLQYHAKGRGNGYVVEAGGKRIYISGDTEDVPEMRALRNIDVAFICFNLPFTMTEEQAASAVREFRPAVVYPYHHRGSDVQKFASLVGQGGTEVRIRDWY